MSENESAADLMRQLERELGVTGPANVLRAALKIAKEAVAEAKEAEPPAPPAWMVEVAREACAMANERPDYDCSSFAREARNGDHDEHCEVVSAINALRLALERSHVVEPRPAPTDEEMLRAAREDAAQVADAFDNEPWARDLRLGDCDDHDDVRCALQARRNMLREGAVAGAAKALEGDLRRVAEISWGNGYAAAVRALQTLGDGEGDATTLYANEVEKDVDSILSAFSTLPTREA